MTVVKETVYLTPEIKKQAVELKNALKTSLSNIYKTAIEEYLKTKEIERWEKGAKLASKNKRYIKQCKDNDIGGFYEY
jgi:post-segregation antitoxin (ccd killing protein)